MTRLAKAKEPNKTCLCQPPVEGRSTAAILLFDDIFGANPILLCTIRDLQQTIWNPSPLYSNHVHRSANVVREQHFT